MSNTSGGSDVPKSPICSDKTRGKQWKDPNNTRIEKLTYNNNHLQISSQDALGQTTQFTYDRNNRIGKTGGRFMRLAADSLNQHHQLHLRKRKRMRLDEKQVVFYSPDYDRRAKADRAAAVAKAQDMVNNPSKYKRATSYGAAKYVKNFLIC